MSHIDDTQEKKSFFSRLCKLDQDEDEAIDEGRSESHEFLKSARNSKPRPSPTLPTSQHARSTNNKEVQEQGTKFGIRRSTSAPNQSSMLDETGPTQSRSKTERSSILGVPQATTSMASGQSQKTAKRKRKSTIQLVPEHQRLFSGLDFCSSPPNTASLLANKRQSSSPTTTRTRFDGRKSKRLLSMVQHGAKNGNLI